MLLYSESSHNLVEYSQPSKGVYQQLSTTIACSCQSFSFCKLAQDRYDHILSAEDRIFGSIIAAKATAMPLAD